MRAAANPGSFRDPAARVYELRAESPRGAPRRVLRGLDEDARAALSDLLATPFWREAAARRQVVETTLLDAARDEEAAGIAEEGWAGVAEHAVVPFVSYPYEWSFAMLRDAALLQLDLTEAALRAGWMTKDATPYNVQFVGNRPVFIDAPSFVRRAPGAPWVGYRQFCAMFLTPLMLHAHLGIDHRPVLRSALDGVSPTEAQAYFRGLARLKAGVLGHVTLPALVERAITARERDDAPAAKRGGGRQSDAMVLGLVQSLRRTVARCRLPGARSDWDAYEATNSYEAEDAAAKADFVRAAVTARPRDEVWDLGSNTGTYARLAAGHARRVVALDADHAAIDRLYGRLAAGGEDNVLPLVMNLANASPAQGWAGRERMAFDERGAPDMVLCLALIHHLRIGANVPVASVLGWLAGLGAEVVIEFVSREDAMVRKLLTNREDVFSDYRQEVFEVEATARFEVAARRPLKGGSRTIYHLVPR